eukprot:g21303.t1
MFAFVSRTIHEELATTAWSAARLRTPLTQLRTALADVGFDSFDARDLAKTAWAFARLRWRDMPVLAALAAATAETTTTPQGVANVLRSFATLAVPSSTVMDMGNLEGLGVAGTGARERRSGGRCRAHRSSRFAAPQPPKVDDRPHGMPAGRDRATKKFAECTLFTAVVIAVFSMLEMMFGQVGVGEAPAMPMQSQDLIMRSLQQRAANEVELEDDEDEDEEEEEMLSQEEPADALPDALRPPKVAEPPKGLSAPKDAPVEDVSQALSELARAAEAQGDNDVPGPLLEAQQVEDMRVALQAWLLQVATFHEAEAMGLMTKWLDFNTTEEVNVGLDQLLRKDSEARWVYCASEGELCECNSGHVRYGHHAKGWNTKKNKARSLCLLENFGKNDMAYGMLKPLSQGKPVNSLSPSLSRCDEDFGLVSTISQPRKVSTCSESLPFSLTASQVALISPSRVSSMERSGYHVAKQVSVPSFAAPSVAASEAEPRLCERRWRLLEKAVSSWQFEAFFAVVIATNSLFIGLSIEWEAQERTFTLPTELFVIQITYTLLFLAEVCLKLLAFGARDFFCSSGWAWNCFDLAIVMSAVFECTVEFVAHDPHLSAGSSSNLRILRILRMTRLTRIFRVIRVVRFFRSLRTLVFSIVNTLKSLFWAMLLLAMIMYVFGILFTDISNNHIIESGTPEAESIIKLEKYFGTLHDSVHTLFMSISGGLTWMDATMALAAVSWVWKYVFSCYIAFSVFAVLNVMTGVFCQSAIKGAERDQEMVVQSLIMDKHQLKTSLEKLLVDLRPLNGGFVIFNQGHLGSCTANALAAAYHFTLHKQNVENDAQFKDFTPSRLFIYYNERYVEGSVDKDAGAMIRDGIKVMEKMGVCPETVWKYDDGPDFFKKQPEKLRTQAAKDGTMVMPQKDDQVRGGHAVTAVGYDDMKKVFIVRNSWGEGWGDKGYFYMPYECRTGDLEPLWSCDFSASRVPKAGHPHEEAQKVLEQSLKAMCEDSGTSRLWQTFLDCDFRENYFRWTSPESDWLEEGFVTYVAGPQDSIYALQAVNLIRSIDLFSTRPVVVVVFDDKFVPPAQWHSFPNVIVYKMLPMKGPEMSRDAKRGELYSEMNFEGWKGPRTMRWGHAHPTWTYWALPFLLDLLYERLGAPAKTSCP